MWDAGRFPPLLPRSANRVSREQEEHGRDFITRPTTHYKPMKSLPTSCPSCRFSLRSSLPCGAYMMGEGIRDLRIYFCWLPALTSVTEGNDNISDNPWARLTSLSWPSASCPWSHRHEPGKDFHKWVLRFQLSVQPVTNDGGSHVATFGSNLMEFKS